MAFVEHRGGGVHAARLEDMAGIWDTHWSRDKVAAVTLRHDEGDHWKWMRRYVAAPARVLEAGCGRGQWVRFFQDRGYEAYGIDFSPVAVKEGLAAWPDLKLAVGDFRAMPYADGFFDAVFSLGAIEHDESGPDAALAEMRRVLRAGGLLYCTVPCMNRVRRLGFMALEEWVVCNRTIRRLTGRAPEVAFFEYLWEPGEYASIIERAGFVLLHLVPLNPMVGFGWGLPGSLRWRFFQFLHKRRPWLMPHMMAAVCRKG